jgi:hypothetical protein
MGPEPLKTQPIFLAASIVSSLIVDFEAMLQRARREFPGQLLGYFTASTNTHLRIAPEDIGEAQVGHFAFFRSPYQATLWPIALSWLQNGELAPGTHGQLIPRLAPD